MSGPELLAAIVGHCRTQLPEGITILQPGDALQSVPNSAWSEFWVDRIVSPVRRRPASAEIEFSLTINCFARPPHPVATTSQLASQIADVLRAATIAIAPQMPNFGIIRLKEPELRDVSRPATAKSAGLWHWIISFPGTATLSEPTAD